MPKLYEYMGIIIFFYSNEHEPIYIHASKAEFESKAEFFIVEGIITEVKISNIKGKNPLEGNDLKDFKAFLENYSDNVVKSWVDYFVYHKSIVFKKINKRLK